MIRDIRNKPRCSHGSTRLLIRHTFHLLTLTLNKSNLDARVPVAPEAPRSPSRVGLLPNPKPESPKARCILLFIVTTKNLRARAGRGAQGFSGEQQIFRKREHPRRGACAVPSTTQSIEETPAGAGKWEVTLHK